MQTISGTYQFKTIKENELFGFFFQHHQIDPASNQYTPVLSMLMAFPLSTVSLMLGILPKTFPPFERGHSPSLATRKRQRAISRFRIRAIFMDFSYLIELLNTNYSCEYVFKFHFTLQGVGVPAFNSCQFIQS